MEEVDYKRVREIMWTDNSYRLRELPAYFEFPILIKVVKGSDDMEHKEKFAKGEILRIDGEERQRRVIATDSKSRHWSFPVHIGAKFEVKSRKAERCRSMYMSEIVDAEKLPKKFCFAKKDDMQIKITGEEHSGPLIEGDFKTKELTRVRIFKANRISDGDIKLKVVFLPAYMDVEVVIATKLACEPDAYWEDYMEAMTRDISKKVNLNMYRGKSDIQIYEFPEKVKKSKQKSGSLYEEQAPTKIVSIGSIIKQRQPSTGMKRTPSTTSNRQNQQMRTFSTPEGAEAEPEEPKRSVNEILNEDKDKDESEMTEEEIRLAKHRRMLLAMLAREEEEEEERRRSQVLPDGAMCDDDEVDGNVRDDNDNDGVDDDKDEDNDNDDDDDDDEDDDDDSENMRGEGDGDDVDDIQGPRSPGDGSTENNDSVFVDDSPAESVRQKPRIPTRRTPGLSYPQRSASPNPGLQPSDQQVDKPIKKSLPPPPLKPKPPVPGQKPAIPPNKPKALLGKPTLNSPVPPHVSTKVCRAHVMNSADHTRFATIQDFPADLRGLNIDDMCRALQLLCLDKYEGQIRENKIDGEMASELTEDMIISDLGLSGLEAKKLYKFIRHNWRPV